MSMGRAPRVSRLALAPVLLTVTLLAACSGGMAPDQAAQSSPGEMSGSQAGAAGANPALDPGSSLGDQPAPGIALRNQFGQPMSLRQFRGKVVILAFVDSECTTICPLTTVSMVQARQTLGPAARSSCSGWTPTPTPPRWPMSWPIRGRTPW
jgi:cytochrome oxidase Cu insertion factor (SCO1/SenC/PrrC family)